MKHFPSKLALAACAALATAMGATAATPSVGQTFTADGINYKVTKTSPLECSAQKGTYQGAIVIPATVTYDGNTIAVVDIANYAFSEDDTDDYEDPRITSVVIGPNVRSIGDQAFMDCDAIKGPIVIPASVTSIGDEAFADMNELTSLQVDPNNTTFSSYKDILYDKAQKNLIQAPGHIIHAELAPTTETLLDYSFERCKYMTDIVFSPVVKKLCDNVFYKCYSVKEYNLPNTIEELGEDCFYANEDLTAINIAEGGKTFCSVNGLVYNLDKTELVKIPTGLRNIDMILPTTKTILYSAGYGSKWVEYITIPNSVETIEEYAFGYTSCLLKVIIGSGVKTIGSANFSSDTQMESLTCLAVNPPTLDDNFNSDDYNATLYVPAASISAYKAAPYWKNFTNVQAVATPEAISVGQSFTADGLNYTITAVNPNKVEVGKGSYSGAIRIPATVSYKGNTLAVTSIASHAFVESDGSDYDKPRITSVTIGTNVETIGDCAFLDCDSVAGPIVIPASVTSIDREAFADMDELTSLKVDPANANFSSYKDCLYDKAQIRLIQAPGHIIKAECAPTTEVLGKYSFERCRFMTEFVSSPVLKTLEDDVFYKCYSIKEYNLPNTIEALGEDCFYANEILTAINIADGCKNFCSVNGLVYNPDKTQLVKIPTGIRNLNMILPTTKIILNSAGYGMKWVEEVTIPNSVETLEPYAICYTSKLTKATIGTGMKLIDRSNFNPDVPMTSFTCMATVPPTCNATLNDNVWAATLYVPASSIDAYKAADKWKNFTKVAAADVIVPPYLNDFSGDDAVTGWTNIDGNNDDDLWKIGVKDGVSYLWAPYNDDIPMDDWMITPAIQLEGGKTYTLSFDVRINNPNYAPERLEVKMGNAATAEAMTTTILPPTEYSNGEWKTETFTLSPETSGLYYIGLHCITDPDMTQLHITNFAISAPQTVIVPPYLNDFSGDDAVTGWTNIDGNNDDDLWKIGVKDGVSYLWAPYNDDIPMDDWMITPAIKLEGGSTYELSFDVRINNPNYAPERLEVKMGNAATANAMTETILAPTEYSNGQWKTESFTLRPATSGLYYIGLHCITDPDMTQLHITNFAIGAAGTTGVENVISNDGIATYYDLMGRMVQNPANGIFIKVQNGKAKKIAL